MNQPLDAAAAFTQLHQAGVEYVLVGGLAVIAWGVQRFTKDVDLCPDSDPSNLERLAGLLNELGARQVGQAEFAPGELPLDPTNAAHLAQGGNFLVETERCWGSVRSRQMPLPRTRNAGVPYDVAISTPGNRVPIETTSSHAGMPGT